MNCIEDKGPIELGIRETITITKVDLYMIRRESVTITYKTYIDMDNLDILASIQILFVDTVGYRAKISRYYRKLTVNTIDNLFKTNLKK
jgi:hypothetical protein